MISQKINLYNLYILHIFRKKSYNKSMKKINIKKLLFYILVPLLSGAIVGFLTSGETITIMELFQALFFQLYGVFFISCLAYQAI